MKKIKIIIVLIALLLLSACTEKTYKVDFIVDGEITHTYDIKEGNKVDKPTDPVKSGYNFLYWEIDNKEYDFNSLVKMDLTLIALFEEITISYLDINDIYLNGDILSFKEIKNATYTLNLNGELIELDKPYYKVTLFPLTVKIKATLDNISGNYSDEFSFDSSSEIIKNEVNYNLNSDINVNYLTLLNEYNYLYILDEDYQLISNDNYLFNSEELLLNKEYLNNIDSSTDIYLLTNNELIKVTINKHDDNIPRVINSLITSSFTNDLVINLDSFDYAPSFSVLVEDEYEINGNLLIINKDYLIREFSEGRKNLIIGYSFSKNNSVYAGVFTIKAK